MVRSFALFLLLLLGISITDAGAEVFRCRDIDGVLTFTDDPAKFPPGCRPVETESGDVKGGLTTVPESHSPVVRGGYGERPVPSEEGERMSRDWRKEARSLAEDFQKAQSRRVPTLPAPTVYQAIEDMQRIERQAEDLRREIAEERLPPGVRSEIERILSVIPPPS